MWLQSAIKPDSICISAMTLVTHHIVLFVSVLADVTGEVQLD